MDNEEIFIILKELGVNKTDAELIKSIQKNRKDYRKAMGRDPFCHKVKAS